MKPQKKVGAAADSRLSSDVTMKKFELEGLVVRLLEKDIYFISHTTPHHEKEMLIHV